MNNKIKENEKVRRFFNRIAPIYPLIERNLFPEYRRVLNDLNLSAENSVLDLATGSGILAAAFSERGHRVRGFDFSQKMLKRAQIKFPKIDFKLFDLNDLHSVHDDSVDIVSMGYFLHGAPADFRKFVLQQAARISRKKVIIFDYCCSGNWLVHLIEWIEGSYFKEFVALDRASEFAEAGLQIEQELNFSDYGSCWICSRSK